MIYYPAIFDENRNLVEFEWDVTFNDDEERVYYTYKTLAPGTYYVQVLGHYPDAETDYSLYTYWRPISELNSFVYPIYDTDFLR